MFPRLNKPHDAILASVRFLTFLAVMVCVSCMHSRTDTPAIGASDAVEMLLTTEPDTVDPRYASDAISSRASRLIHAGLFKLDPKTFEPAPDVAQSWVQESPTRVRVLLRSDATFHSGAPLTCEDVRATLSAVASPETRSRAGQAFRNILVTSCVSPHEVLLELRAPQASLLADLCFPVLRADQAAAAASDTQDGLGPYRVRSRELGLWTLEPAFPGQPGAPTRVVRLRAVGDENARALRLLSGRADIASGVLSPMLADALGRRGMRVRETDGVNLTYLVARTDAGPSAARGLRSYLRTHTPRAEIIAGMLAGHARIAEQILPPRVLALAAEPQPGQPGQLGQPVAPTEAAHIAGAHAELLVGTDRMRVAIARAMADEWAKGGVTVDVVPLDLGVLLGRLSRGEFMFAMLQLPDLTEPGLLRTLLHSKSLPPYGMNRSRYANARVDAWLDAAESELNLVQRRALYARVEEANAHDLALMPLWREQHVAVVSERALSYAPGADGHWGALCDLR